MSVKDILKKAKWKLTGLEIRPQIQKNTVFCGTEYGGFYVVPELFEKSGGGYIRLFTPLELVRISPSIRR